MDWPCRQVLLLALFICIYPLLATELPSGPCSGGNRTHRVQVEFTTQVVENEYIIQFDEYYPQPDRVHILRRALNYTDGQPQWYHILERNNPATEHYASDFDVVRIEEREPFSDVAAAISRHPQIRSVTPQRIVHRNLKYVRIAEDDNDGEQEQEEEDEEGDRFGDGAGGTAEELESDADLNDVILDLAQRMDSDTARHLQSESSSPPPGVNDTASRVQNRRLLRAIPRQITSLLKADVLWGMGITGRGIKVAVFDTGLAKGHPHFKRIKERTNWTNEKSLDDGVSHGTFVAGVIASSKECLGFAPDAELHIFRVFTNNQVSYTSWFLDAFNYAILKKINVLNLSIGGPDFLDQPFVDKVSKDIPFFPFVHSNKYSSLPLSTLLGPRTDGQQSDHDISDWQ